MTEVEHFQYILKVEWGVLAQHEAALQRGHDLRDLLGLVHQRAFEDVSRVAVNGLPVTPGRVTD